VSGGDLRTKVILLAAALLLFISSVAVGVRLEADRGEAPETDILFLPAGKHIKQLTLGYDNVIADAIYIWSIQYYTDFTRETRYPYLLHTFDVITDLDPQFIDAYMVGALTIVAEGKDRERATRLLHKGMVNNPGDYLLPLDAGYYYRDTFKNPRKAAYYFGIAAGRPAAPNYIKRLCAGMTGRAGDKRTSYELWKRAYDEAEKEEDRRISERHLRILYDEINLEVLSSLVDNYHQREGHYPSRLAQLVSAGLASSIPLDGQGEEYGYDPSTGKVWGTQKWVSHGS
jgi:hypothetical protein